jgi:hypothetical protein
MFRLDFWCCLNHVLSNLSPIGTRERSVIPAIMGNSPIYLVPGIREEQGKKKKRGKK